MVRAPGYRCGRARRPSGPDPHAGFHGVAAPDQPGHRQRDAAQVVPAMIDAFLRGTSRVVAVVLRWEEQHLERPDGALILYKFRLERGTAPKVIAPSVDRLLAVLAGPSTADRPGAPHRGPRGHVPLGDRTGRVAAYRRLPAALPPRYADGAAITSDDRPTC